MSISIHHINLLIHILDEKNYSLLHVLYTNMTFHLIPPPQDSRPQWGQLRRNTHKRDLQMTRNRVRGHLPIKVVSYYFNKVIGTAAPLKSTQILIRPCRIHWMQNKKCLTSPFLEMTMSPFSHFHYLWRGSRGQTSKNSGLDVINHKLAFKL